MSGWEERLAETGHRITASRRAVVQVLLDTSGSLSPRQIRERGEMVHPGLGLVSVYRTLALLENLGLVRRVHCDNGCHAYLWASPGHRHVLICRKCGRAVEFPGGDDLDALTRRVEVATGYKVDDHLLQLEGLCPQCLATEV